MSAACLVHLGFNLILVLCGFTCCLQMPIYFGAVYNMYIRHFQCFGLHIYCFGVVFFMEFSYVVYLGSIFSVVDYLQCWGILLVLLGINSAEDC